MKDGHVVSGNQRDYKITAELGRGANGRVWKATSDSTVYALKEILPKLLSQDKVRRRFEREIEIAGRLNHQNILRLVDYVISPRQAFYVMPYFAQGNIAQFLQNRYFFKTPIGLFRRLLMGYKVHTAIAYCAKQTPPVLHRDIKPANILMDDSEEPVLSDFGVATFLG